MDRALICSPRCHSLSLCNAIVAAKGRFVSATKSVSEIHQRSSGTLRDYTMYHMILERSRNPDDSLALPAN